jgi:hypothetical protein
LPNKTEEIQDRAADKPSEYVLLCRALARSSESERRFIYEFLAECSTSLYDVPEIALREASAALKLGMLVEGIKDYAEDFSGLTQVTIDGGWLYRFLNKIFKLRLEGKAVTPEIAMDMLAFHQEDLDTLLEDARKVLRSHPGAVADDIRKAVASHPELLGVKVGAHEKQKH